MTDYHTVIAQAVESLDPNTSRTRQVLYERARTALVTHLRAIHPPLSESAIAKERLSLESAIREVEADIASETEPRESKPLRENRSVHSGRGYALQSNFENRGISAAVAIKPSTPLAMVGCSSSLGFCHGKDLPCRPSGQIAAHGKPVPLGMWCIWMISLPPAIGP
jgi:hypothetical protein